MRFQKGQSGNLAGRPKGSKSIFSRVELELAIQEVEKEKKKSLYKHLVQRAYKNDAVLIALVKKLVPDVQVIEENEDWLDSELSFSAVENLTPKDIEELTSKYIA